MTVNFLPSHKQNLKNCEIPDIIDRRPTNKKQDVLIESLYVQNQKNLKTLYKNALNKILKYNKKNQKFL